ncbi:hypothetical protein ARMGADRAFT_778122 [Armillaria gallica]|uniref:Uncharacterized protein n=1 Tax=Armillaria gallica TaxID=47427 RepID=A0A2H3CJG3_ARMGA|nr:hypothetical protein ARMGADRAFT_778122 [Armillaria gallica]
MVEIKVSRHPWSSYEKPKDFASKVNLFTVFQNDGVECKGYSYSSISTSSFRLVTFLLSRLSTLTNFTDIAEGVYKQAIREKRSPNLGSSIPCRRHLGLVDFPSQTHVQPLPTAHDDLSY